MYKGYITFLLGIVVYAIANNAIAETKVTGFASMVGGVAIKGDQFLADYPNTGLYDGDISFSPDTTIGVQLKTNLQDDFEFIVQIISRGANEYATDIDWAYLNHSLTPELSVQIGRKRLPLYYYSDFFDLGFAYYWIRPPADSYTWQITNYNGLSLAYEPELESWDALFNLYIGREDDQENQLLSFLASNNTVNESWRNIFGFVAELSDETFDYRFTFMSSELYRDVNNIILSEGVGQLFYGLSVNANFDQLVILSELNRYERPADDIMVTTSMLSVGYKIEPYTPHFTWSRLKQSDHPSGADEHHYTYSLGLRRDLTKSVSLKVQYDKTTDKATASTIVGDGELLSFGLDFIF